MDRNSGIALLIILIILVGVGIYADRAYGRDKGKLKAASISYTI